MIPKDCKRLAEVDFPIADGVAARGAREVEAFLGRLHEDLAAIRAYPPTLRWFAHNEADAAFLA